MIFLKTVLHILHERNGIFFLQISHFWREKNSMKTPLTSVFIYGILIVKVSQISTKRNFHSESVKCSFYTAKNKINYDLSLYKNREFLTLK